MGTWVKMQSGMLKLQRQMPEVQQGKQMGLCVQGGQIKDNQPVVIFDNSGNSGGEAVKHNTWLLKPNGMIVLKDKPHMGLCVKGGQIKDNQPLCIFDSSGNPGGQEVN